MPASIGIFLLAYVGGILTIVSPCILPVLPFFLRVRTDPFAKAACPC